MLPHLVARDERLEEMRCALELCSEVFGEMDNISWDEDSDFNGTSYDEVKTEVNDLLHKIEIEEAEVKRLKGDTHG